MKQLTKKQRYELHEKSGKNAEWRKRPFYNPPALQAQRRRN